MFFCRIVGIAFFLYGSLGCMKELPVETLHRKKKEFTGRMRYKSIKSAELVLTKECKNLYTELCPEVKKAILGLASLRQINILLERGIVTKREKFLYKRDQIKNTFLHFAAQVGNKHVMDLLFKKAAKLSIVDKNKSKWPIDSVNQYKQTAAFLLVKSASLKSVSEHNLVSCMTFLCRKKADLNIPSILDEYILDFALKMIYTPRRQKSFFVYQENRCMFAALLISAHDKKGLTLLHHLVIKNDISLLEYCLKSLAGKDYSDIDRQSSVEENTALHLAAKKGLQRISQLLINYGASLDIPNAAKVTPRFIIEKDKELYGFLSAWCPKSFSK